MWVRKSSQQIAKERRMWSSFRGPLLWFLIMFVGGVALTFQGPRFPVTHWPSTWQEAFCVAVFPAAIVAVVAYLLQLILKKRITVLDDVDVVICDACHRVKRRDSESTCECGGKFEDFDNWTWIEGGKTE